MLTRLRKFVHRRLALSSGTFVSFEAPLTELCRHLKFDRVLEFGPGKSTQLLLEHTQAQIRSIETSKEWFDRYRSTFDPNRVEYLYLSPDRNLDELLQGPAFDGLSRVPVAQLFRERSTGDSFLVAVNHLKSKGRCPDVGPDTDQGDGQGCWNRARLDAVNALLPWLNALAEKSTNRQVLILGDMNAWRLEDPIRAFRAGGYIELVEELSGLPQYSFVYFGQRGTLDYALASPSLRARTRQATIWHSNADWPRKMSLPQPWLRMSDHDPVVIDLEPSQSATSD